MLDNHQQIQNVVMIQDVSRSGNVDIQKVVRAVSGNWGLFVFFLTLFVSLAFLYNRYSSSEYKIHAKILVKDSKKGGNMAGSDLFQEIDLFGNHVSVDNEVELLKSRTLMEKTVDALHLNTKYFVEGNVKTSELYYNRIPFALNLFETIEDSIKKPEFTFVKVNDASFILKDASGERAYNYNDTIVLPFAKAVFRPSGNRLEKNQEILIKVLKRDDAVAALQKSLSVAPTNKTVSTIDLTFSDELPKRGEDLLNTLLMIYDQMNKEDKNRIADSTIQFIDERLEIVSRELGNVEEQIQGFRQKNELTDISTQGKQLIDNSTEYLKELNQQEVQIEIVGLLEDYLKNQNNSSRLVPSTLTIQEPNLIALVQAYNTAQLERDRQLLTTAENNPVIQQLNTQILNARRDILANLANIKNGMAISRDQLRRRTNLLESQMRQVPRKERAFLEYSRQQSIKQELYLYLLKKREETAVSKSANVDNARVVDSAKSENLPFKPRTLLIYALGLLAGVVVPALVLYFKELLNTRIIDKSDIVSKTTVPIISEIGHNPDSQSLVVKDGGRSPISEQFRSLRTNLQFLMSAHEDKSMLITSSMSGEGKSFVAINLASAIALSGKSVVIMELDLRKPNISKTLGIDTRVGFSNYVIGEVELNEVLIPSGVHENLFVIPSGPLPPNPSELIMSPKVKDLFASLRSKFDFIVIDTAPVGLVTDAQLLTVYSDLSLFVVRQKFTYKQQLGIIEDQWVNKKFPKLHLIVNDVKFAKGYGYGYGYGYGDIRKRSRNSVQ